VGEERRCDCGGGGIRSDVSICIGLRTGGALEVWLGYVYEVGLSEIS